MSVVSLSEGQELESIDSEDFAFKPVTSFKLLKPIQNIPFIHQNLLAINEKIFVCASNEENTINVIDASKFRAQVEQQQAYANLEFDVITKTQGPIVLVATSNDCVVAVTEDRDIYNVPFTDAFEPASWEKYTSKIEIADAASSKIIMCKLINNNECLLLTDSQGLYKLALGNMTVDKIADDVFYFDTMNNTFCYCTKTAIRLGDKSFKIDLEDEDEDNKLQPLSATFISDTQLLCCYGSNLEANETDVSYDHRMFVVNTVDASYSESFDITPAFADILRKPLFYNAQLLNYSNELARVSLLASATSSEISIVSVDATSSTVNVQLPIQDSDRAVLPMDEDTDQDTIPVGVTLDCWNKQINLDKQLDEHAGIDQSTVPLLYVLNNQGLLQIFAFVNNSALASGSLNIEDTIRSLSLAVANSSRLGQAHAKQSFEGKTEAFGANKGTDELPTFGDLNLSQPNINKPQFGQAADDSKPFGNNQFELVKTGLFGSSDNSKSPFGGASFGQPAFGSSSSNKPAFEKPLFGASTSTQPTFGQPTFGDSSSTQPAFGKPGFGASGFGDSTTNQTAFGKPGFGKPAFGESGFGQSAFGDSTTNQPTFGKPSFGDSSSTQPTFGKPGFGESGFGDSTTNQTAFGKPGFDESGFGKPAFGDSTTNQPTFGKPSFGDSSSTQPTFGKPGFGESGFGKLGFGDSTTTQTGFSEPLFGAATSSQPTFGKLGFAESGFGKPALGESESGKSPFGNAFSGEISFGKSAFNAAGSGNSPFADAAAGKVSFEKPEIEATDSNQRTFGTKLLFGGANNFGDKLFGVSSEISKDSPFAKIVSEEENDTTELSGEKPFSKPLFQNTSLDTNELTDSRDLEATTSQKPDFKFEENELPEEETKSESEEENISETEVLESSSTEQLNVEDSSESDEENISETEVLESSLTEQLNVEDSSESDEENISETEVLESSLTEQLNVEDSSESADEDEISFNESNLEAPSQKAEILSNKKEDNVTETVGSKDDKKSNTNDIEKPKFAFGGSTIFATQNKPSFSFKEAVKQFSKSADAKSIFSEGNDLTKEFVLGDSDAAQKEASPFSQFKDSTNKVPAIKPLFDGKDDFKVDDVTIVEEETEKSEEKEIKNGLDKLNEGKEESSSSAVSKDEDISQVSHDSNNAASAKEDEEWVNIEDESSPATENTHESTEESLDNAIEDENAQKLIKAEENEEPVEDKKDEASTEDNVDEESTEDIKDTESTEDTKDDEKDQDASENKQIEVETKATQTAAALETKSTQATVETSSMSTQTTEILTKDEQVFAFKDESKYLNEVYAPIPLNKYLYADYYADHHKDYSSKVMNILASFSLTVNNELVAIEKNVHNLDNYFQDQVKETFEKDESCVNPDIYWRLNESKAFHKLITFSCNSESIDSLKKKIAEQKQSHSDFVTTSLDDLFLILEKQIEINNKQVDSLSVTQLRLKLKVDKKVANLKNKIEKVSELIKVLKLYAVLEDEDSQGLEIKNYLNSLPDRTLLVQEIQSLRKEVSALKLENNNTMKSDTLDLETQNVLQETSRKKNAGLVELAMKINSKRALGDVLRNRTL